jgi:predicted O-linked N-acetylglucosamine transferase (SPINDLY family)
MNRKSRRIAKSGGAARAGQGVQPVAEAMRLLDTGSIEEGEKLLRRCLATMASDPVIHYGLGIAMLRRGRFEEAEAANRRALELRPDLVSAANHLGIALKSLGRRAEAEAAFRQAIALKPDFAPALNNLGNHLREGEDFAAAEAPLREAVRLDPALIGARVNLADTLRGLGRYAEAEEVARAALALAPDSADAFNNLGNALRHQGRIGEAAEAYEKAIAASKPSAMLLNNLANARRDMGRIGEAIETYRRAIELDPRAFDIHSSLIFALDFDPAETTESQQRERDRWWALHGARHAAAIAPHPNPPDPERRLRIGYVTAHFRRASSASAFGPVILGRDREKFEAVCYSGTIQPDGITEQFRRSADLWRDTRGVSDDALARQIRDDKIDILVDLAGHMAGHRLAVFARRPAPVQVTGWGQANGTGLRTIDYLLSDPISIPYDERPHFAEYVADLPCSLCFAPPGGLDGVAPLPAFAKGQVTFGCFNRVAKVTDPVLDLWARLLARVPGSRLLLKDAGYESEANRGRVLAALARHGVEAARVAFLGYTGQAEHLNAYRDVDIALDPFPLSGGITTLEALWMGVPVVTLKGRTIAGRGPAAILGALGLTDYVAESEPRYIEIAQAAARDIRGLGELRQKLRPRFAASPLGNVALYTRHVEAQYRAMWRRWCAGHRKPL